jgi:hypothetical protein
MPASAIMPIIAVAVKKVGFGKPPISPPLTSPSSQNPGRMPISVNGIEIISTSGMAYEPVW